MQRLTVIEAFASPDDRYPFGISIGDSLVMDQFLLQHREETLGAGIVVAVGGDRRDRNGGS